MVKLTKNKRTVTTDVPAEIVRLKAQGWTLEAEQPKTPAPAPAPSTTPGKVQTTAPSENRATRAKK